MKADGGWSAPATTCSRRFRPRGRSAVGSRLPVRVLAFLLLAHPVAVDLLANVLLHVADVALDLSGLLLGLALHLFATVARDLALQLVGFALDLILHISVTRSRLGLPSNISSL